MDTEVASTQLGALRESQTDHASCLQTEVTRDKDVHLTQVILEKYACEKKIKELQEALHCLTTEVEQLRRERNVLPCPVTCSDDTLATREDLVLYSKSDVLRLTRTNSELVDVAEKLQKCLTTLESESNAERLRYLQALSELEEAQVAIKRENEALKKRVADDILRQRQSNRIEVAAEKVRMVAQLRLAGRQRLEAMEQTLMEAHDDLYHIQRCDALFAPHREVSFLFQCVSLVGSPEHPLAVMVTDLWNQITAMLCSKCHGYRVCSLYNVDVFAFQSAAAALRFAKECHEQTVKLSWPSAVDKIPCFATISDFGKILFRGPRLHTCIYACTPELEVDPVTGRTAFFGNAVSDALHAALELASVGEIVVNDAWANLLIREARRDGGTARVVKSRGSKKSTPADGAGDLVMEVRHILGEAWEVVTLSGKRDLVCAILPKSLKERRSLGLSVLWPTPEFPYLEETNHARVISAIMQKMKDTGLAGHADKLFDKGKDLSCPGCGPYRQAAYHGVEGCRSIAFLHNELASDAAKDGSMERPSEMMAIRKLQLKNDQLQSRLCHMEKISAALERSAMEAEDHFVLPKEHLLAISNTAYVCTIDVGNDDVWGNTLSGNVSDDDYSKRRQTFYSMLLSTLKKYNGFLLKRYEVVLFVCMLAQVETALAFVSELYTMIDQACGNPFDTAKANRGERFLMRASITSVPMPSVLRNAENKEFRCTPLVLRSSVTLCDAAYPGEVLALKEVVDAYYRKKENLLSRQYHIVRQKCQFFKGFDTPLEVYWILPRSLAYRHQSLVNRRQNPESHDRCARSIETKLICQAQEMSRAEVDFLLQRQLERLESSEAMRLAEEDAFEKAPHFSKWTLLNPWMVTPFKGRHPEPPTQQTAKTKASKLNNFSHNMSQNATDAGVYPERLAIDSSTPPNPLAFLYCNMARTTAIAHDLPPALAKEVLAHYNYIVQSVVRECGGFVAKTDAIAGYVVLFRLPYFALDAAFMIQKRLLSSNWPEELKTSPSAFFSRDFVTHTVLFNGPRAQIALHYSDKYSSKRNSGFADANMERNIFAADSKSCPKRTRATPTPKSTGTDGGVATAPATTLEDVSPALKTSLTPSFSSFDLKGPAFEQLRVLGEASNGGEMRISIPFLEAVRKDLRGRLLLSQLTMQVTSRSPCDMNLGAKSALPNQSQKANERVCLEPKHSSDEGAVGNEMACTPLPPINILHGTAITYVSAVPASLKGRFKYFIISTEDSTMNPVSVETLEPLDTLGRKKNTTVLSTPNDAKILPQRKIENTTPSPSTRSRPRKSNKPPNTFTRSVGLLEDRYSGWWVNTLKMQELLPRGVSIEWGKRTGEASAPENIRIDQIQETTEKLLALLEGAHEESRIEKENPPHHLARSQNEIPYYSILMHHSTNLMRSLYNVMRMATEGIKMPSHSQVKESVISHVVSGDLCEMVPSGVISTGTGGNLDKKGFNGSDRNRFLSLPEGPLPGLEGQSSIITSNTKGSRSSTTKGTRTGFSSLITTRDTLFTPPLLFSKGQSQGCKRGAKVDPYASALGYMEEVCQCLAISIRKELERLPNIASSRTSGVNSGQSRLSPRAM